MLNKRKMIGCLIDFIVILLIFTFLLEITKIIFYYMNLNENILIYSGCLFSVIIIVYLLPAIFKRKQTIGKLIAKKLIKKEDAKFTFKEIIILLIILLIISFI